MNQSIFKLRSALEEAIRSWFVSQDIAAITRQNQPANFIQARPRVEIRCRIGAATGRRHICPDGILRFDAWAFDLAINAVTSPDGNQAQNTLHEDYLALIRSYASSLGGPSCFLDTANFPLHYIAEPIRDGGTDDTLKTEEGVEYSVLTYSGIFCIRHSAWT